MEVLFRLRPFLLSFSPSVIHWSCLRIYMGTFPLCLSDLFCRSHQQSSPSNKNYALSYRGQRNPPFTKNNEALESFDAAACPEVHNRKSHSDCLHFEVNKVSMAGHPVSANKGLIVQGGWEAGV